MTQKKFVFRQLSVSWKLIYKGHWKELTISSLAFYPTRDPLLFRKYLVIMLPYSRITLFLMSHDRLWPIYCVYSSLPLPYLLSFSIFSPSLPSYLDLLLSIGRDGQLHTSIYDKRDDLISTSQTFRSWVVIFHLRRPIALSSLNLYGTPGLATRRNVSFWGTGDLPVSSSNRDTMWNALNRRSGSLWSIRGSYSTIWSLLLTNVKWHSNPWLAVTSQPIRLSTNLMTLILSLIVTELWVVSM